MSETLTPGELLAIADGWPHFEALPMDLPPVPPFALDLLPAALRPWIADISDRMQCPADYPAVAAMIALAAIVGRQVAIRPKALDDWTVTPNLWGGLIGRPALLKTPAMQEALAQVDALEARAREDHEAGMKDHAAAEMIREAEQKKARTDIAEAIKKGHDAQAKAIATEATQELTPPVRRRYKTNDATVEKLGELLRDNPNGLLLVRDELLGLLRRFDQEGRETDRAFFLEAWNGSGNFTADRIGRGTIEIPATCLSIVGAIQPGPLCEYMAGTIAGGAGDDGLMQRFQLAVWPDAGKAWRNVDRAPDAQARASARAIYNRLNHIDAEAMGAQRQAGDAIPWLRFTPPAQERFNTWRDHLEHRLREDDLHPAFESHLAKYRSLVPSLALLCHLADNPDGGPVDLAALLRALMWAEHLEHHARRIFAPALVPELVAARELAKRLGALSSPFTAKEIYRNHWRALDIDGTRTAITVLLDFGYIREAASDPAALGRPTTRYDVRPSLRGTA